MIDFDKWQEIFYTINKNRLRTFLTAFGVFWGIFMLVILLGSGIGLENGTIHNFRSYAVNSIYMWPQKTTMPYKGLRPGRFYTFRNDDIEKIKAIPELDVVSARIQLGGWRDGNNVTRKDVAGNYQVMGDFPEYLGVQAINISEGRFINSFDIKENRKVCIIGEQVYKELFESEEQPIGDYITIRGVYFKVVGLFKSLKRGDESERDSRTIYIPFTTFQQAFNYGDRMGWFAMTSAEGVPALEAEKKAKMVLASRHNISPEDEQAIGSFNVEDQYLKFSGLFEGINIFVWLVGLGTIFAGVVGVSNIMLIVVNERTKEIGIRKAVGATPWSIIGMIIQESIFLTTVAGYSGLVAGVGLMELITVLIENFGDESMFFKNPGISFSIAMSATIILIISGTFAGLVPARKAVTINPIEALRSE